jgi:hypothetical protein
MSADGQQYAVVVTRPDNPQRPPNADLIVRVGPYGYLAQAQGVARHFTMTDHQRSRPAGTTIAVEPYDATLPHRPTLYGAGLSGVVDALTSEADVWGEWSFPDTFDLLGGVYSHEEASRRHMDACLHLDTMAEQAEEEQRKADRERLDAEDAAHRFAPCRDAAATAARRRVEKTPARVIDTAGDLIADLLDVADRYEVNRPDLLAAIAPVVLDAIAERPVKVAR